MTCTIVVGGQYGSEGKGKVVSLCSAKYNEPWIVRCGGPNSGHTTSIDGTETILRQVPAGASHPESTLLLSAGCAIDLEILFQEIDLLNLPRERVIVDPRAVMITDADRENEKGVGGRIGSTVSGTGAALIRRMSRLYEVKLAADSSQLRKRARVETVAPLLHSNLDRGGDVIVEGTQGFALSLLHGFNYPFLTSRDTTASGFIMEVGLSPRQVDSIIMVIRTFPIRVGGNSGPLSQEITWEEVQRISGAPQPIPEYTSVTKRLRRVSQFDILAVKTACMYNRPTALAIMGLDRLDYNNHCVKKITDLTERTISFVRFVENSTGIHVELIGTGFNVEDALWYSSHKEVAYG